MPRLRRGRSPSASPRAFGAPGIAPQALTPSAVAPGRARPGARRIYEEVPSPGLGPNRRSRLQEPAGWGSLDQAISCRLSRFRCGVDDQKLPGGLVVSADSWRGAVRKRVCRPIGSPWRWASLPIWIEGLPPRSHRSAPGASGGERSARAMPLLFLIASSVTGSWSPRCGPGTFRVWVSVLPAAEVAVEGEVVLRFSPGSGWLLPAPGPPSAPFFTRGAEDRKVNPAGVLRTTLNGHPCSPRVFASRDERTQTQKETPMARRPRTRRTPSPSRQPRRRKSPSPTPSRPSRNPQATTTR